MNPLKIKESIVHTWLWIIAMIAIIFMVGYFAFTVVSDKGKSTWDLRSVKSIPSQSPYAEYPEHPLGQHVDGRERK